MRENKQSLMVKLGRGAGVLEAMGGLEKLVTGKNTLGSGGCWAKERRECWPRGGPKFRPLVRYPSAL